jgi:hypothetical protein
MRKSSRLVVIGLILLGWSLGRAGTGYAVESNCNGSWTCRDTYNANCCAWDECPPDDKNCYNDITFHCSQFDWLSVKDVCESYKEQCPPPGSVWVTYTENVAGNCVWGADPGGGGGGGGGIGGVGFWAVG